MLHDSISYLQGRVDLSASLIEFCIIHDMRFFKSLSFLYRVCHGSYRVLTFAIKMEHKDAQWIAFQDVSNQVLWLIYFPSIKQND